jgi:hypothetical protein
MSGGTQVKKVEYHCSRAISKNNFKQIECQIVGTNFGCSHTPSGKRSADAKVGSTTALLDYAWPIC